jgi:hypothetical protein
MAQVTSKRANRANLPMMNVHLRGTFAGKKRLAMCYDGMPPDHWTVCADPRATTCELCKQAADDEKARQLLAGDDE